MFHMLLANHLSFYSINQKIQLCSTDWLISALKSIITIYIEFWFRNVLKMFSAFSIDLCVYVCVSIFLSWVHRQTNNFERKSSSMDEMSKFYYHFSLATRALTIDYIFHLGIFELLFLLVSHQKNRIGIYIFFFVSVSIFG